MKWVWGVVAVLIAIVVFIAVAFPSVTTRYRLTLEAIVDGETKTGSGVIEVTYGKNSKLSRSEISINVRGEAVALDLGSRGTLFALLREGVDIRSGPEWIVFRAAGFPYGNLPSPVEDGFRQVRRLSGTFELPLTSLPLLVRFRDPNDQLTVEKVDPLDIAASFGSGAKLTHATLQIVPAGIWPWSLWGITGEPITGGIEQKLPWWNAPKPWLQPTGSGTFIDTRTDKFKVYKGDFKK
jgi:hypothetical protein